jgi:heterodisulfide reductase subunit B
MKNIPDKDILLFKSCLVSTEYPGIESSTQYIFDKIGVGYLIDEDQSCCTGLGHYSDVFDQFSTTLIAARNFYIMKKDKVKHLAVMCATCYAINKKSANLLNKNSEVREKINNVFKESSMDYMQYEKDSINSVNNIFHVVEILFKKKDEIAKLINVDFSRFKIATHHACHYCKVYSEDLILEDYREPELLDALLESLEIKTIGGYNSKISTCGAGFRQRFVNKPLSMKVTGEKLLELNELNVDILIHMCPNCQMQFDRYQPYLSKQLKVDFNIVHLNISQLIALVIGGNPYKTVGIQTHTVPIEILIEKLNKKA